ncbi:MAG: DUF6055 domain-containing protein, partial [Ignavibacteriaceae bacterium]
KDSKIQRFKDSKIQRFKDSKIQRFKDSKIQRFKDSKIQRLKDSKILNINISLSHNFTISRNSSGAAQAEGITRIGFIPIRIKSKITITSLLLFLFIINTLSAQEKNSEYLDSLYNAIVSLRGSDNVKYNSPLTEETGIKCAFSTYADVRANFEQFNEIQKAAIGSFIQRVERHTSIVSPSGLFRVHFDTTGTNTPIYEPSLSPLENAQLVADALDSAYSFEVNHLGYLPPPADDGSGGDTRIDLYIENQGRGLYGYTQPENDLGNRRWTAYMVIDEEYGTGYSTHGEAAMRATVAHELHHVIQVGSYVYEDRDQFFMELTSTSMEEFVFDDVNDYYAYMRNYFNNTSRVFSRFSQSNDGYDLAIWNIFLADSFGIDIIRRQWELLPQMRALDAINTSLVEKGSSFFEIMNQFGVWCYFTNYRTVPGQYFEEAESYPAVRFSMVDFNPPSATANLNSPPAANTYINFINAETTTPDSLTAIVTNTDFRAAIETPDLTFPFEYTLFNYDEPGAAALTRGYYFKSQSAFPEFWSTAEMLDNQLIRGGHFIEGVVDYVFPSPFYYSKNSTIYIPAKSDPFAGTDLNIYSPSMDLVYSSVKNVEKKYGQSLVLWNAKDNNGNKLPSGVYMYAVKTGDETSTGKIVIFND